MSRQNPMLNAHPILAKNLDDIEEPTHAAAMAVLDRVGNSVELAYSPVVTYFCVVDAIRRGETFEIPCYGADTWPLIRKVRDACRVAGGSIGRARLYEHTQAWAAGVNS